MSNKLSLPDRSRSMTAVSDVSSIRVMRRTGRLYNLTLFSCLLTVFAATLVAMWDENSATFHLWFDIVPQGFGMASVITTTLIVRPLQPPALRVEPASEPSNMLVHQGDDRERHAGGPCCGHRQYVTIRFACFSCNVTHPSTQLPIYSGPPGRSSASA